MSKPSDYFGSDVFDYETMRAHLPKSTYKALMASIHDGKRLTIEEADVIAHAMMEWSISKGVTHYTHWFQPLTGRTAQKHDAFLSVDTELNAVESFSGAQLIQSEPDASSFPSGGMRSTFEARGYTAWDPSSPVFIVARGSVKVLCIPSIFFSYTGHALDKKTPLLRSVNALDKAASKAIKLLREKNRRVQATVGAEQEYFLVDRELYQKRPDLVMSGRTLIGRRPPKGQQMEDHYFGSIKDRVLDFMEDLEKQLYRLGVPCKTRHNEVAPHQYEMAPTFLNANLSADHNQLVMEMLQRVAAQHGLAALLHEKPFSGVNGSGKHLNWSMSDSAGNNLLEPGSDPQKNRTFLYFLVAVVNAIHKRGDLLRSTIASVGNDHRLGANEAPPAIMSVFLGSHLNGLLNTIENATKFDQSEVESIDLGLAELPQVVKDTTDRNRTSPFAFTGNKFEFRAVGSNQSLSLPIAFLNAAVTESLNEMNAELEKELQGGSITEASLLNFLRPIIKRSKDVRFEGNNYGEEWHKEAEKRGLANYRTTPEALAIWNRTDIRDFLKSLGVLDDHEIDAHRITKLEGYSKAVDIEASTMMLLVDNHLLPASMIHQSDIAVAIANLAKANELVRLPNAKNGLDRQADTLDRLASRIGGLIEARERLEEELTAAQELEEQPEEAATAYASRVIPAMDQLRNICDQLEMGIDAKHWPLPGYHELLFLM